MEKSSTSNSLLRQSLRLVLFGFGLLFLLGNCTGTRPDSLGIRDQKLAPCPKTPNCVGSFEDPSDQEHYIASYNISGNPKDFWEKLKRIVTQRPRTALVKEEKNYLYFESTSFLFRYVDDLEFYLEDSQKRLHVRSASRLGKSDLGVNRKRVNEIFQALEK